MQTSTGYLDEGLWDVVLNDRNVSRQVLNLFAIDAQSAEKAIAPSVELLILHRYRHHMFLANRHIPNTGHAVLAFSCLI